MARGCYFADGQLAMRLCASATEVAACCAWALLYSWLGIEAAFWPVETGRQFKYSWVIVLALYSSICTCWLLLTGLVMPVVKELVFDCLLDKPRGSVPSDSLVMRHERVSEWQQLFAVRSGRQACLCLRTHV